MCFFKEDKGRFTTQAIQIDLLPSRVRQLTDASGFAVARVTRCFLFEESIFIIAGFMEKFLRIKPEIKGGNLFSFDAAIADG